MNDFDALKPFRGQATNLTSTLLLEVGSPTVYPVRWRIWTNLNGCRVEEDDDLLAVKLKTRFVDWSASPIDSAHQNSFWLFGEAEAIKTLRKIIAPSFYEPFAREGVNTRGANGIFFVDAWMRGKQLFVANRTQDGRGLNLERVETSIEDAYLYPLLRGKDVSKWKADPSSFIVLPHDSSRPVEAASLASIPKRTREFLARFKEFLSARKRFRNFDSSGARYYGIYSVLSATFAEHKVVWREMADGAIAAACSTSALPDGSEKVIIPDHELFIIPCKSGDESHFVAAVFNSSVASYLIKSYALSTGISTHILHRLGIPQYDEGNSLHLSIRDLASECAAASNQKSHVKSKEEDLDRLVAGLYGLSERESGVLISALADLGEVIAETAIGEQSSEDQE